MKLFGIPAFISALAIVACTATPDKENSAQAAPQKLSAADSTDLHHKADSLLSLIEDEKIPEEEYSPAYSQACNNLLKIRAKQAWFGALLGYCRHLRTIDQPDSVIQVLDSAIQHAWWSDDGLKGRLYLMQGYMLRKSGRNYASQSYLEKAKFFSDTYGGVSGENPAGGIYKTLAGVKTRLGDYEGAIKILSEALVLIDRDTSADTPTRAENQITKAELFIELGIAHHSQENPVKAMEQYAQGLAVLDAMKTVPADLKSDWTNTRGVILTNTAGIHLEAQKNAEAEQDAKSALRHIDSTRQNYLFNAFNILAEVYAATQRDELAQASWQSALTIADTGGVEKRELAKLLNRMGWAAFEKTRYEDARAYAQEALHQLYPAIDPKDYRQNPQSELIDPFPENAVAEALDLKGESLYQLYKNHSGPGNLAIADSTTSLAIEMMENLRNVVEYESSKLRSSSESRRLFGRMMRILYAEQESGLRHIPERAFTFAEKSKAVLLRQKIAADAARKDAGAPASLIAQEHDLKDQWVNLKNQLFERQMQGDKTDDSVGQAINRRIFNIEGKLKRAQQLIADASQHTASAQYERLAGTEDVRKRLLRNGEVWIEYFTDSDSSQVYSLVVDKGATRFLRRPYAEEEVRGFIALINNETIAENRSGDPAVWADFVRRNRRLYENLLQPAFSGPVPGKLTIAPDGALALLPFDVLLYEAPVADSTKANYAALSFLLYRCQSRLAPSASLELFFKETRRARPSNAYAGFAPDYSNSVLGQVKSGANVVQDAAVAFKGRSFTGLNARVDTFLQYAPGCAIVHFHGHAEASDSFPDYSWMAFSAGNQPVAALLPQPGAVTLGPSKRLPAAEFDNCLFAHQVYNSRLDADLVLLSACQTGLGKIAPGEGTLSLSRAFQAAGCPATLMSLWKVRDDATATLMQAFLENIRQGQDKDEALANAKRDYLKSNSAGDYPYFWAGFVLTGTADPVRLPGSVWRGIAGMALAAAVFAAVLFFALRRKRTKTAR